MIRDDHAWCLDSPNCNNIMCYRHSHNITNPDIPHSFTDRSAFPECLYPVADEGASADKEKASKMNNSTTESSNDRNKWHVLEKHPYDLPQYREPVLIVIRSSVPLWNLVEPRAVLTESYTIGYYDTLRSKWSMFSKSDTGDVVAWHPIPKYTPEEG